MAEPLKNLYSPQLIERLAQAIQQQQPEFDTKAFKAAIFNQVWPSLALKERMTQVTKCLHESLNPLSYAKKLALFMRIAHEFKGFEMAFFPEYVATYGLEEDFELNMQALACFTEFSTAEFAVRPFIQQTPQQMLQQALIWADSDNEHHRRLASEGFRPRLPWSFHLTLFKDQPHHTLPILEKLKADASAYVRKSVANHLNDISKDHPDLVIFTAKNWQNQTNETDWIIKHACRSLLKQSHPQALMLFGFQPPSGICIENLCANEAVAFTGNLDFAFQLKSAKPLGKLRIEFEILFQKAKGKQLAKRFQISETEETALHKDVKKTFSFKPISTRTYYPGPHQLSILVNGETKAYKTFELKPALAN